MVSREDLQHFTLEMAKEISENAPLSLKTLKKTVNVLGTSSLSKADEKLIREMTLQVQNSEDYKEGQKSFAEKRKPSFKGK
jgi:1,4-dihydroxy-2-naphthoyl-CoA synthase